MTDAWQFSIIATVVSALAIFLAMFTFVRSANIRESRYLADRQMAELDKTREAFETEISKLHEQIYKEDGRFKELNHLLMDAVEKQGASLPQQEELIAENAFLTQMGVDRSTTVEDKFVFVLTPFSKSEEKTYERIRSVCQTLGLSVRRGDEKQIIGSIFPHILSEIAKAWLVVANLNDRNPNVFYELGIAQALGKPCLLIGKSGDDLPFDLSHQQVVLYRDLDELKLRLTEALSRVALGHQMQSPMRTYAHKRVPQEMILRLSDPSQMEFARLVLISHDDIKSVFPVGLDGTLLIKGVSNSRQFITDVSDHLKKQGINSNMTALISGADELK